MFRSFFKRVQNHEELILAYDSLDAEQWIGIRSFYHHLKPLQDTGDK